MRWYKVLFPLFFIATLLLSGCQQELRPLRGEDIYNCNPGLYNVSDFGWDEWWFDLYGKEIKYLQLERDGGICKWYINTVHVYDCRLNSPFHKSFWQDSVNKTLHGRPAGHKIWGYWSTPACKIDNWFDLKVTAHELNKAVNGW